MRPAEIADLYEVFGARGIRDTKDFDTLDLWTSACEIRRENDVRKEVLLDSLTLREFQDIELKEFQNLDELDEILLNGQVNFVQ